MSSVHKAMLFISLAASFHAELWNSCGIEQGADVYVGCGFAFQRLGDCQEQCKTCTPTPFHLPEGKFASFLGGSCGLDKWHLVSSGCGYVWGVPQNCWDKCPSCTDAIPFVPAPAPAVVQPTDSCGITRRSNVFNGCGHIYQKLSDCQQQCGICGPQPFIPGEGAYVAPQGGSCGISLGQPVYSGCGIIYEAYGNCYDECGRGSNASACSARNFVPALARGTASPTGQNLMGRRSSDETVPDLSSGYRVPLFIAILSAMSVGIVVAAVVTFRPQPGVIECSTPAPEEDASSCV